MGITLYAHDFAPSALVASLALREKGVQFDFVSIDLAKGENKAPAWLEKHPLGKVPVLVSF